MKLENLLESKEFNISVGRMIERMQQAAEHNWDWLSFNGDSIDYDTDEDVTVSIELVPEWANLENIDSADNVDLYNEYNETDYHSFEDIRAAGINPYKAMDVKIRTLDYSTTMDETLQVYYIDEKDRQKVNSLF
jgi:hypothetical protein